MTQQRDEKGLWMKSNLIDALDRYIPEPMSGCWIWEGAIDAGGYGELQCQKKRLLPDHLEPVTMKENLLRGRGIGAINIQKTHCLQGHPFNESNTHVRFNGHRVCRTCAKERKRKYLARSLEDVRFSLE